MTLKLKQRISYGVAGLAVVGVALALTFTVGGVGSGKSGPKELTPDVAGELLVTAIAENSQGQLSVVKVVGCKADPNTPRQFGCVATVAGAGVDVTNNCGGFLFTVGADPARKVTFSQGGPVDLAYCQ